MNYNQACKILQVQRPFSKQELKDAFKKQALVTHPDKGGSEEAFKLLNEAHEFLKENDAPVKTKNESTYTPNTAPSFGKKRKPKRQRPLDPKDAIVNIQVSVKELYKGFEQQVQYSRRKACSNCGGEGCHLCAGQVKIESLVVAVYIHSTLLNSDLEIIYDGLGDETYEKADLILKLSIVDEIYSLRHYPESSFPVVYSEVELTEEELENRAFIFDSLAGKIRITLPDNCKSTINLKGKGLLFETIKGHQRGDHYIHLKNI